MEYFFISTLDPGDRFIPLLRRTGSGHLTPTPTTNWKVQKDMIWYEKYISLSPYRVFYGKDKIKTAKIQKKSIFI